MTPLHRSSYMVTIVRFSVNNIINWSFIRWSNTCLHILAHPAFVIPGSHQSAILHTGIQYNTIKKFQNFRLYHIIFNNHLLQHLYGSLGAPKIRSVFISIISTGCGQNHYVSMYLFMYVFMCKFIYVFIYLLIYFHIFIRIFIHILIHTYSPIQQIEAPFNWPRAKRSSTLFQTTGCGETITCLIEVNRTTSLQTCISFHTKRPDHQVRFCDQIRITGASISNSRTEINHFLYDRQRTAYFNDPL